MSRLHLAVLRHCVNLPEDYEPYGTREHIGGDCSCGCVHYHMIEGDLGGDWGICGCPESHRYGLLTFEHQGCDKFEAIEGEGLVVHCAECGRGFQWTHEGPCQCGDGECHACWSSEATPDRLCQGCRP